MKDKVQGLFKQTLSFRVKMMWDRSLVPSDHGGRIKVEAWETLTDI